MKMAEKTKKYLTVGCGVVVCAGLIAAISLRLESTPVIEDSIKKESSVAAEIVVNPSKADSEKETSVAVVPTEAESIQSTETEAVIDTQPVQSEQSIQPEVTKPEPPAEEVLQDPTQKPDGTKMDTPLEPVEHDTVEQPEEIPADPGEPQAGETKDGLIYIPGFGWVENKGGGSSGTVAEDMYENGNKIGIMD